MTDIKKPTGTARWDGKTLTIITNAKRGKKTVKLKVTYTVADLRPDPRVADPAFSLTKEDGEVYHVAWEEYGPACSCPAATFRGANERTPCKHVMALQAVGLMRKYPGE